MIREGKRLLPDWFRPFVLHTIAAATSLTVWDTELRASARRLDSLYGRVLAGDLAGAVFLNPTGQSSPAYLLGRFEDHVSKEIRRWVRAGDLVFDVGANVGWHTIRLARRVGENGHVVSFEPSPHDRELLKLNIEANGLHNVVVDARAVAERSGATRFLVFGSPGVHHIERAGSPSDGTMIEVEAISLDKLVYEHGVAAPTFMKVDVEGGEVEVLRGAHRLLRDARPTVVVEARQSVTVEPIAQLALQLGYSVTTLSDGETCDLLLVPDDSV